MGKRYHDDMSMDELMRHWPAAIRVLLDHGLLCVGCPIATFHTVDDAVLEHGIDGDRLRDALRRVTGYSIGPKTEIDFRKARCVDSNR